MNDLRTAAQQALEALGSSQYAQPRQMAAITALRAALAQQADPTDPGRDVDVLREHVRHLERRVRQLHAQQAEPVEPHRWEGDNNIESPFNACMHKTYCMTLKQAEPLNLRDPAVQKRLATQWGYVPAAQAEPVEDVLLSAAGLALDALEHDRQAAARSGRSISMLSSRAIEELRGAFRAALAQRAEPMALDWLHKWANQDDGEPETQWHEGYEAARRVVQIHLTAPPQRRPLTEEEIESCRQKGYAHAGLGAPFDFGKAARAVEKASWEKNHGQA